MRAAGPERRGRGRLRWRGPRQPACGVVPLLALLLAAGAAASPAPLHRTAWSQYEGAPPEIEAMVQASDGQLWLASPSGLFGFDGVRFDGSINASLLHSDVTALLAEPGGALWIGYRNGGLSRLQRSQLQHYGEAEGLPAGGVLSLARDGEGTLWAAVSGGLARLQAGRWEPVGAAQGYGGRRPLRLLADAAGRLWVADAAGIFLRSRPSAAFRRVAPASGAVSQLLQAADGTIWASDPASGLRRLDGPGAEPQPSIARSGAMLARRDGTLWLSSLPGLLRLDTGGRRLPPLELAARDAWIMSMLEDREGNVWLGKRSGLERLRPMKFTPVALPQQTQALAAADREAMSCASCPTLHASLFLALAPGDAGNVWVGSRRQLMRVNGRVVAQEPLPSRISSAYRDPDGQLWLGGESALWRLSGGVAVPVALPAAVSDPQDQIQAITRDAEGALWISVARKGVHRLADGVWTPSGGIEGLPPRPAIAMLTDRAGHLWFSYREGRIARYDGVSLRFFGVAEGLPPGPILVLHQRNGRLWAGGARGVWQFRDDRFEPLQGVDGERFANTSGIVETAAGELWINGLSGAVRIDAAEIARLAQAPRQALRYERFDYRDGLDGAPEQIRPLPTLVEGDDGRLWFATNTTLAWIDPARIARNPLPPTVVIRGLRAGGESFAPVDGTVLPKHTTQLQIDYSALSLSIPERVRFRYRLEGVDAGWQDAGTRRSAFYTNLGLGPHRFRVIAANEDGLWNEAGASLAFSIEPTITQTLWFRIACLLLLLSLLWLIYLLRLRQMSARIVLRFRERQSERERIARELHDTLLQGFQGVILRLQAVMLQLQDGPMRAAMEQALERADAVLAEGRDRVGLLREASAGADSLRRAIATLGHELIEGQGPQFRLIEEGLPRALTPLVREELFGICREALFNALLHARARSLEVDLCYRRDVLRLRVRDDGRGIDPEILAAGGRPGHYGLSGMRERAQRMGALLDLRSRTGLGTELTVTVPASCAYAAPVRAPLGLRLRRLLLGEDIVERAGTDP